MKTTTLTALGLMITASAVSAAVVNVDLNATLNSSTYSGAGAYPDPDGGTFWSAGPTANSPSASNLTASDGTTATTIDYAVTGTGTHGRTGYTNPLLKEGTVNVSAIALTGLDDDMTYDLTFYSSFGNFGTTFTVGAAFGTIDGAPTTAPYTETFVDGQTYTTLSGIATNGSGGIDIAVTKATASENGTFVAGFQIAAVPEPSSATLLGLGGLALFLRRRK